jgi:hypothetical protein
LATAIAIAVGLRALAKVMEYRPGLDSLVLDNQHMTASFHPLSRGPDIEKLRQLRGQHSLGRRARGTQIAFIDIVVHTPLRLPRRHLQQCLVGDML